MNKLALGTVQFGLDYGLTNDDGQVESEEVDSILKYAKSECISILDTAPSYGNCEQVLGAADTNGFEVVTKTTSLKNGIDCVMNDFRRSLNSLNRERVYGLLVHDIKDIYDDRFDRFYREIIELKECGLVGKIGFSTYTPEQVDFLLKNFDFDLIQVPFNVFDDRLVRGGQLNALSNRCIEVHARSIFLQGLLLNFVVLPGYFESWKEKFNDYRNMVKDSGMSLLEYAINYVVGSKEIDRVLVGVNEKQELIDIVSAIRSYDERIESFPIKDKRLLDPSLWSV